MEIRIKTIYINISIIWNSKMKENLLRYIMIMLESVRYIFNILIAYHIQIYYMTCWLSWIAKFMKVKLKLMSD